MILRTFSMPKPGEMARFMTGLNWQAAWLSQHFNWIRVVVGYALTDIPERVLEIYAVPLPESDIARARRVLAALRAQQEYKDLLACCRKDLQREEELLPALGFETRLKQVVETLQAEQALVARRKNTLEQLEQLRTALAQADARIQLLDMQIAKSKELILTWQGRLDQLEGKKSKKSKNAAEIKELRDKIKKEQALISKLQSDKQTATTDRSKLASQQADEQKALDRMNAQLRDAMDPVKRNQAFEMMINIPAYFLKVTIHVKPGSLKRFEEGMERLARDFKWDFLAACRPPARTAPPGGGDGSEEVMNLWGFKDANNLYRQMTALRENERFAAIEEITGDEVQMLMCDWEALSGMKQAPPLRL